MSDIDSRKNVMRKNPAASTFILLTNYSFEVSDSDLNSLIVSWLSLYPGKWVLAAIVEAIYQGRYKVHSVSRILDQWRIKGYPVHHFDYDFADTVCKKLSNLESYEPFLLQKKNLPNMKRINHSQSNSETVKLDNRDEVYSVGKNSPKHSIQEKSKQDNQANEPNYQIGQCERLVTYLNS